MSLSTQLLKLILIKTKAPLLIEPITGLKSRESINELKIFRANRGLFFLKIFLSALLGEEQNPQKNIPFSRPLTSLRKLIN